GRAGGATAGVRASLVVRRRVAAAVLRPALDLLGEWSGTARGVLAVPLCDLLAGRGPREADQIEASGSDRNAGRNRRHVPLERALRRRLRAGGGPRPDPSGQEGAEGAATAADRQDR